MNFYPFGYEYGYNYVVGNGDYDENMHQGWNNQRWEEPQAHGQLSWQQLPPVSYRYNSILSAYQSNGYGRPSWDYQQPYAYEPHP